MRLGAVEASTVPMKESRATTTFVDPSPCPCSHAPALSSSLNRTGLRKKTGPDVSGGDQPSDTVFSAMNCDARGWRPETFSLTTQTTLMYAIETVGSVSARLIS